MKRYLAPVLALAACSAFAVGCGTTEESAAAAGEGSGESITVTDARGQEVVLDGPAERTVGTEWNVVEHLVSLGVMPVGVADVEGYSAWASAEPLDDSPADIGTRGEPSVDTIAGLNPDLIVGTTDLSESAIAQLEELAPVIVVRSADAGDQIGQMFANLELIAEATGTEDQVDQLKSEYDAKIAEGKAAIEAAGLSGQRFLFADGWVEGGAVSVRPFGQGSLVGEVIEQLGLVNAWEGEVDEDYGLGTTDVEGLTGVQNVDHFVYIANASETDPFGDALKDNAIWQGLPFVQSGDVRRLPDSLWMFGGPTSMMQFVDAVVASLTNR
jgi:ABC-type Fe3+-hydroxamate transport system substrate-binding protein